MDYQSDLFEELLEAIGVTSYEELKPDEREAYQALFDKASSKPLTIEDFRTAVHDLRVALDKEIATHHLTKKRDLFLKARLANCIFFEEILMSQEDAIRTLKETIENIKIRKGIIG